MALKASELNTGDVHEASLVEDLKRTQIVQYAGASGDYNPLHITDYVGDGRLKTFGVRFTAQVFPGDDLSGKATVEGVREEGGERIVDLKVETTNQDGAVVLSGYASARVDP
jgi:acyl dehydratase